MTIMFIRSDYAKQVIDSLFLYKYAIISLNKLEINEEYTGFRF